MAEAPQEEGEKPPEIDENHPEVAALVEKAVQMAEERDINIPAEMWIDVMEEAIKNAEDEMRKVNPDGPMSVYFVLCCYVYYVQS